MNNEQLVELYQDGDKQALEELVGKNKGIVNKLVNKYYTGQTNSIDRDDLMQEGFIGLITAADRYDFNNEKKAQFITYAVHWINCKINRFVKCRNTNEETSLNTPIGESGESERMDFIEGVDYSFENVEEQLYLKQLRADLGQVMNENTSLKEREILKLHYGWYDNKYITMNEVGDLLNMPGKAATHIENKAMRKIRKSKWCRDKIKEHYQGGINSVYGVRQSMGKSDFMDWYLND